MAKMKNVTVRGYNIDDVPEMAEIWNEVCLLYTSPSPRDA